MQYVKRIRVYLYIMFLRMIAIRETVPQRKVRINVNYYTGWSKSLLCTWWLQYSTLQAMFKVSHRQSPDIYWHAELCSRWPCSV